MKFLVNVAFGLFAAVLFVAILSDSLHQEAVEGREIGPVNPHKIDPPQKYPHRGRKVFVSTKGNERAPGPFNGITRVPPVPIYRGENERERRWNETWEKLMDNQRNLSGGKSLQTEIRP